MSLRRPVLAFLALLFATVGSHSGFAEPVSGERVGPSVTVREDGLLLEWITPEVEIRALPEGEAFVELPGFEQFSEPGAPQLPFTSTLVALPPGANPTLEIIQFEEKEISLPGPLSLASKPQGVHQSTDGQVIGGAFAPVAEAIPFAPDLVELEPLGVLRGVELARVVFYPARPAGGQLHMATHVQVLLKFNQPAPAMQTGLARRDPLLNTLEALVINPEQIQPNDGLAPAAETLNSIKTYDPYSVAIEVTKLGLISVAYEDLAAIGYPIAEIDRHYLRISQSDLELPYEWEGDGDASFEPGERLLFYAEPRFSRWTQADVYLLQAAETPGILMETRPADPVDLPAGLAWIDQLVETNSIYTPNCYCAPIPAGRDEDRWVWEDLNLPSHPAASFDFQLTAVDPNQPASLLLWLIGYTDVEAAPDHRVEVALNGTSLGLMEWDGKQAASQSLSIPASVLEEGENILTLSLPGLPGIDIEGAWLDAFSIRYARSEAAVERQILFSGEQTEHAYTLGIASGEGLRAYDVTDPDQPLRLQGFLTGEGDLVSIGDDSGGAHRYFLTHESEIASPDTIRLASSLKTDTSGADYVIIAPQAFFPALEELRNLRQSQGSKVAIEDVQAIYDIFGDGRPSPAAIRAYLADAYTNWEVRPVYVLLVGDGTYDPKQYLSSSLETHIPPYLAEVDPWAGETAADNRYVTLEGDDNLPEMLIGRLPVNSLAETQAVVDKIVQYETNPASGSWPGRGVFVADDPDGGGNFPTQLDSLLSSLGLAPIQAQRLYFTPPEVTATQIRQGILQSWNTGSGLVVYSGHSSIRQWAVELFFHQEDVDSLRNGARLPLVVELTCFTGSFHVPGFSTLDETLLRHSGGGAVAIWGPTGLGIATGHESLAEGFLHSALVEANDLGTAVLAGKINLATHTPTFIDLIDTYILLGDPAMRLNLSVGPDSIYLPLIQH